MRICIDRGGPVPIRRQITDYLRQTITAGSLPPGTKLPSTRELAASLGVSRLTVETAYADLRADGLVVSRIGSGNYVDAPPGRPGVAPSGPWPSWQLAPAGSQGHREVAADVGELDRAGVYYASGMLAEPDALPARSAGRAPGRPDLIDLSTGTGDPKLFPVEALRREIGAVLARDGAEALQYAHPWGYPPLRQAISSLLAADGIDIGPPGILVTAGSQQAIALAVQVLARAGDTVVAESPTYPGALRLFAALGLRVATVPADARGMQVDRLEAVLAQHQPRLIYSVPTFGNPAGSLLANDRRAQLLELATRYQVPVIEDDYIGDLRYEGQGQPALAALDRAGTVLYTGTFSKMLAPGFRVGFIAGRGPILDRLAGLKSALDLATSHLTQRTLERLLSIGRYREHLDRSRRTYRRRRDEAARALRQYLPDSSFDLPRGGMFMWLRLPRDLDCEALLVPAWEQGVAFMPGSRFFARPEEGLEHLRLNFAASPAERVTEGIRRIGLAMEAARQGR